MQAFKSLSSQTPISGTREISTLLPDLTVTSVSMSPANPAVGQDVTFTVVVENQGTGATPAGVVIGVVFSVDGAPVNWSDTNSTALAPGASLSLTANSGPSGVGTWKAVSGSHTLQAEVNDIRRFAEANEANNTKSMAFSVSAGASPAPIANLTASPTSIMAGGSSTLTWSSSNATSCTGTGFSTGNSVSGSVVVKPTASISYSVNCTGAGGSAVKTATVAVTAAPVLGSDPCLPFPTPAADAVLNSAKKVFVHYVPWSPLSIDNLPASQDYYAVNYLNPDGEGGKFKAQGGNLRQRPLPVAPSTSANWQVLNMQKEIRMAIARGVNGFAVDTISATYAQPGGLLQLMLKAAEGVDPRFQILLVPDMSGVTPTQVKTITEAVYKHPSLYKWSDQRPVVSPYASERYSQADWNTMTAELAAKGINIAFIPMVSNIAESSTVPLSKANNVVGLGNFGNPGVPEQLSWTLSNGNTVHNTLGKFFFDGLTPQGYQIPGYTYVESSNSLAYRNAWDGAIQTKADMIQIVTWNDLGETTNIEPTISSTGEVRNGFYNLTAYYTSWWRNGVAPAITHDVLYYFYRKMPTTAAAPNMGKAMVNAIPGIPAKNQIELLAFLTAPGTLSININGSTYTQAAPAGITSFTVPIAPGVPTFSLSRGGPALISFQGDTKIYGASGLPNGYLDLTYWSNSASAAGVCKISLPQ